MSRTTLFLALAAALACVALLLGAQRPVGGGPLVDTHFADTHPQSTATDGVLTLQSRLSHPFVTAGASEEFLTIEVSAPRMQNDQRTPVNLAVVIDRSGSMNGEKLADAKAAARQLVKQLSPADRLTIIHYGSDVRVFDGLQATEANRERMLSFIDSIEDEGGTNIGDALSAATTQLLAMAKEFKVTRAILITDGQPTEGLTDSRELDDVVKRMRAQGVTVSAIGVGADFNEDLLQAFAAIGGGSYGYLQDTSRLAELFTRDLQRSTTTVARNVELTFELPDGVELNDILGYTFSREGRRVRVTMPDFFAGDIERLSAQLNVHAAGVGRAMPIAQVQLTYSDLLKNAAVASSNALSATVTDDVKVVAAREDRSSTLQATRALSANHLRRAAISMQRGDRDAAKKELDANDGLLDRASKLFGSSAMAPEAAAQSFAKPAVQSARSADDISHATKAIKGKAMSSFGMNNAY